MRDERYKFRKGDLVRMTHTVEPTRGVVLYHHLGYFAAGTTYVNILWINGESARVDVGSYVWDNTEVLSRA